MRKRKPEPIPDEAPLWRRVPAFDAEGRATPAAFDVVDVDKGLSVDWGRYSTPAQTRGRVRVPGRFGIAELVAGPVRAIALSVQHTPSNTNDSHSTIGELASDPEFRVKLARQSKRVISPEDPVV
jgi:hypothetical protein